jgi:hypothetical protein
VHYINRFIGAGLLLVSCVAASLAAAENAAESVMESTLAPMPASGKKVTRKEVQKHWQSLINQVVPLATMQISRTSTFYPFAAVQNAEGQIRIVSAQEARADVSPADALAALRGQLATLARNERLWAVVYLADAAVTRKDTGLRQTGIRIKLDHASGEAMEGFLPYVRQDDGSLKLLTPEYRPSRNVTFP